MQIERIKIDGIKPYKLNAKEHPQEQIDRIKASIKEFGFNDPIAVDADGEVIEGHGRLEAMKQLGREYIDVIRLSHLTPEQKRAYVLVHNRLTLETGFDDELLKLELDGIGNIDMTEFGFDLPEEIGLPDEGKENSTAKRHSLRVVYFYRGLKLHLDLLDRARTAGFYQMPTIGKTDHIPDDLIGFNYCLNKGNRAAGLHCFIDDYQIERLWTSPLEYVEKILEYDCFLTPDFSLYTDMPMAMKVWNVYRSRLVGQVMQDSGVTVIPTVSWAEPETFSFCFDGLEKGSVVAVSTIGVKKSKAAFAVWKSGMDELIKRLEPSAVLCYGGAVGYDFGKTKVIYYKNHVTERMKETGGRVNGEKEERRA